MVRMHGGRSPLALPDHDPAGPGGVQYWDVFVQPPGHGQVALTIVAQNSLK